MSQLSTALGSNAGSTSNASWASMATANMQRLKPNARFKGTHDLGFMLQVCVWGASGALRASMWGGASGRGGGRGQ